MMPAERGKAPMREAATSEPRLLYVGQSASLAHAHLPVAVHKRVRRQLAAGALPANHAHRVRCAPQSS